MQRLHGRLFVLIAALIALVVFFASTVVAGSGSLLGTQRGPGATSPDDPVLTWALGFDTEDEDMMRNSFTEDARFVFHLSTGGDPLIFEGIDEVMDLFLGSIAAQTPDEQRRHVTTNVVIEQHAARTATVTSYLTLLIAFSPTDHPTLQSTGIYTDTVVKERDGVWRISERILELDTPS